MPGCVAAVPSIFLAQECPKVSQLLESADLGISQMAAMRELAMLGGRWPMCGGVDPDHPCHDRDMGVILHRRGDERAA